MLLSLLALAACSTPRTPLIHSDGGPTDAGIDAGEPDAGLDAGPDAGIDGGIDAGPDGGLTCGALPVFGDVVFYPANNNTDSLVTADLNQDGIDDLIQGQSVPWTHIPGLQIYYGQTDGGLAWGPQFPGLRSPLAIADLNLDGWPDLVAPNQNGGVLVVEMNQRDGSYSGFGLVLTGTPYAVAIADFDGDGRPDIAACTDVGISIFFDDGGVLAGAPGFLPSTLVTSDPCYSMAAAPLSSGAPAALASVDGLSNQVSIRFGLGDGGFLPPAINSVNGKALSIRAADLNNDGLVDLAVYDWPFGISVFLNLDGGTFGPEVTTPLLAGVDMRDFAIADLNGDGYADFLSGTLPGCAGEVFVLLNDCKGGFPSGVGIDAGLGGDYRVTALKSAGRSLPSIVAGDLCSGQISILPNLSP
jgi:hypothetical protein